MKLSTAAQSQRNIYSTTTSPKRYSNLMRYAIILLPLLLCGCKVQNNNADIPYAPIGTQGTCKGVPGRLPKKEGYKVLCNPGFAIVYSRQERIPRLVVEYVSKKSLKGNIKRNEQFEADRRIIEEQRAELSDYVHTGYDRGHLAPAADMRSSQEAMDASFLLSNIAPQNPTLNREAWAGLENATRNCAFTLGELAVYTGTLGAAGTLGNHRRVVIPQYFFKAWISSRGGRAWIMPNTAIGKLSGRQYAAYEVPINTLRRYAAAVPAPAGAGNYTQLCSNSLPAQRPLAQDIPDPVKKKK